jgi:FkbM family methyltransferase
MKNIVVEPSSLWRSVFPLLRRFRNLCWKAHDRIARRFVVSGGDIPFMDAALQFPPGVAMAYATPLLWDGPDAYEAPTSRTLAALVARSRVFLDIGSNIGIYAVYAGVKHPAVTTYAFEPVPVIWEKNRKFHQANRLDDSRVLHIAVGDRAGVQQLILPIYDSGLEEEQTGTLQSDSWQAGETRVEKIDVQCTTLDEFAATHSLPEGLCCVKIDVENHEAAVFRGGRQFIGTRRPWIVCEILPAQKLDATGNRVNDNGDVVALVLGLGYVLFAITAEGFFRMNAEDFVAPRQIKDFLLIPLECMPAGVNYFPESSLASFMPSR